MHSRLGSSNSQRAVEFEVAPEATNLELVLGYFVGKSMSKQWVRGCELVSTEGPARPNVMRTEGGLGPGVRHWAYVCNG